MIIENLSSETSTTSDFEIYTNAVIVTKRTLCI